MDWKWNRNVENRYISLEKQLLVSKLLEKKITKKKKRIIREMAFSVIGLQNLICIVVETTNSIWKSKNKLDKYV